MDWNSLKIFLAINDAGSLSGAAEQLSVNHSTIFRRLNSFEDEIGGRLFERFNNQYLLTPLGEELLVTAREIASSFDSLDRQIVGKDIQPHGTVKITAPNNIAYRFLPDYISDFSTLYPDISVEILASNQTLNMSNRQADIAIRATAKPPEHLVGRRICQFGWSVYGSAAYKRQYGLPNKLEDLQEHILIGAIGGLSPLPPYRWLEKHHAAQITTRCDDMVTMSYMAESGRGLAILPDDQARLGIDRLFKFNPATNNPIWLLTHPDLRNVTRIKLMMNHLANAFINEPRLSQL